MVTIRSKNSSKVLFFPNIVEAIIAYEKWITKKLMITHDFPTSTHIARIHYNPDNAKLKVEFRKGSTYEYEDVPYEVYNGFIEAESAGKYFNAHVKSKYRVV